MMAIGHATVDFYQGAVPTLVPFLVAERHYGYAAASGIVLAATLLSSIVQPLFGALTDRWTMPWLIPASSLGAGLGIALSGPGDSYVLTWLAVALSGIGVAAYHPESARLARTASRGSHVAMGWYSLGGNIGFALAPVAVSPVLSAGGLSASPWLVAPAVAGVVLTASAIRSLARRAAVEQAAARGTGRDNWPEFLRLSAVIVCRSIIFVGLSAFIALYAQQRVPQGSATGSAALFTLFAGGAVGTVLGGPLAARWGRVRTLRIAYGAAVPTVAGLVFIPGPALYAFAALTAAALYVPFSLHVTLGQDYLPNRVGTASGVTLGLAVSVGGVASPAIGALADVAGLRTALAPLIALCALAWLIAGTLTEPEPEPERKPEPEPGAEAGAGAPGAR
ncbi:MFS transporter [Streptomyces sp. ME19-01-6]|uniref:MFS transporter n=1 Tax=Streptomyces sp. ME19-01-6 TaxID=3028686 RepID=UPI0029A12FA5|nr:MFS transporter [Streptomyces sp. ME19-01-6]MDX3228877.1 MFS transporter [Streptomyces sp. ME19-01-6]